MINPKSLKKYYAQAMQQVLLAGLMFAANLAFGESAIEFVPVAVWQGKITRPWSVNILNDLRTSHPDLKMVHAIDAAPLIRGGSFDGNFREFSANGLRPGDDIIMHLSPWKSLVERAKIPFRREPTAFGAPIALEDCTFDCGLELGLRAFSGDEIRAIVETSRDILRDSGFGNVKVVYFDEGIVTPEIRSAALSAGLRYDWSGIEITQLRSSLGRFPVGQWNIENISLLHPEKTDRDYDQGLNLDHLRYSIHAEIGELDTAKTIIRAAIQTAKQHNRIVRVPLVFNIEDLVHTREFVDESMVLVVKMAAEGSVKVVNMEASNSSWDPKKIRDYGPGQVSLVDRGSSDTDQAKAEPESAHGDEDITRLPGEAIFVPDSIEKPTQNIAH